MSIGICKLCNQTKKLAKAHIIPRSFFLQARGESKNWLEARQRDVKDVEGWQNGIWDDKILCADCDNSFSSWDDYGFKILGSPPGNNKYPKNDLEVESFVLKNLDYKQLKLFILSALWRASVSSEPFFSRIQLGKHEATIADMIRNRNPGSCEQFSVTICRLVHQDLPNAVFPPYRQKSPEGVNFNFLFVPSVKITIKVDRRPLPKVLEPCLLKPEAKEFLIVPMPLLKYEILALQESAEIFQSWSSKR